MNNKLTLGVNFNVWILYRIAYKSQMLDINEEPNVINMCASAIILK